MNVYTVFCRFIPTLKWDLLKKFCHSDEGGSTFPRNVGTRYVLYLDIMSLGVVIQSRRFGTI